LLPVDARRPEREDQAGGGGGGRDTIETAAVPARAAQALAEGEDGGTACHGGGGQTSRQEAWSRGPQRIARRRQQGAGIAAHCGAKAGGGPLRQAAKLAAKARTSIASPLAKRTQAAEDAEARQKVAAEGHGRGEAQDPQHVVPAPG